MGASYGVDLVDSDHKNCVYVLVLLYVQSVFVGGKFGHV